MRVVISLTFERKNPFTSLSHITYIVCKSLDAIIMDGNVLSHFHFDSLRPLLFFR